MVTTNQAASQAGPATQSDEVLWEEIVATFDVGSNLHKAAFSQLQGSAQPFDAAIAVLSHLPKPLRKRSQKIIRSWASQEVKLRKTEQAAAKRLQREHELALLAFAPKKQASTTKTKRAGPARANAGRSAKRRATYTDDSDESSSEDSEDEDDSATCIHPSKCTRSGRHMTKGFCKKHGGYPRCKHESDCLKRAAFKGFCGRHGGIRLCRFEGKTGCPNQIQKNGLCGAHGGRHYCKFDGCTKHPQKKGLCVKHGGGKPCAFKGDGGCATQAVANGMCVPHGGGYKLPLRHNP